MTRKEILNTPELVDFMLDESVIADSREKLHKRLEEICNLAIEALEQEPCEDVISRYGVPHKIAEFFSNWNGDENSKMEISVSDMREITSMFVTKCQAESKLKALQQQPCEDAISRKAYIERYRKWGYSEFGRKIDNEALAIRVAMSLPPVQPKQKTGRWVLLDECSNSGYYCSECHKKVVKEGWSGTVKKIKFCPNCGAKMVEPQESEET